MGPTVDIGKSYSGTSIPILFFSSSTCSNIRASHHHFIHLFTFWSFQSSPMYMSPSIPVSYPCHSYSGHTSLSDMFLQFLIGKSKKLHITGENKNPMLLYCTIYSCTVLYRTVPYCTVLYQYFSIVLPSTINIMHCTALHCNVLFCTVPYHTILYFTVL